MLRVNIVQKQARPQCNGENRHVPNVTFHRFKDITFMSHPSVVRAAVMKKAVLKMPAKKP